MTRHRNVIKYMMNMIKKYIKYIDMMNMIKNMTFIIKKKLINSF